MGIGTQRKRLGDVLVENQIINKGQFAEALAFQRKTGQKLTDVLVNLGFVTEDDIIVALVEHQGMSHIRVNNYSISPEAISCLEQRICRQHTLIPISRVGNVLTLAMADPLDLEAIDTVERTTGMDVEMVISRKSDILTAIDNFYGPAGEEASEDVLKEITETGPSEFDYDELEVLDADIKDEEVDLSAAAAAADAGPIVRLVNYILVTAVEAKASDIHIEPFEKEVRVRLRVDGDLMSMNHTAPKSYHRALVSRIKVMSNMKLDETRLPQDQRARILLHGRHIDFRVSTVPTYHGEKVVMRILDKENLMLDLRDLGFEQKPLDELFEALDKPYGMVLVTGPTGSGKTTTLYSALIRLNKEEVNVCTVEEPVEYELPGINQVHCRSEIGLTFASALRSFLRQDPDIIMLGEIRDRETADIAIKSALTGHLVLSTLHTNTAIGAVARLEDMGVEPFMVASSVILTTAQRLLKKLCSECKEPWEPPIETLKSWRVETQPGQKVVIYKAKGCAKCNKGFKGRLACMESFTITEQIRDAIMRMVPLTELEKMAKDGGMALLRENGMASVMRGLTTREEVVRVTTDDE